ncbi:MAG: efflux RND transporter periplasmic adaptor subunit [Pseudomonadota bacterium]
MNKKQSFWIILIAVITVILGSFILRSEKPHSENKEEAKKTVEKVEKASEHSETSSPSAEKKKEEHHEEDKVVLNEAQRIASGIEIKQAGSVQLKNILQLPGEIKLNEDRTAHVVPRLSGVVESVSADLGQYVKKGQVLAVLASTALSEYRSGLLSAQQRLGLAQSTYSREKKLWEEKISAEQDYLQAKQALHEAEINVRNAREKLLALGAALPTKGALNRYELRAPFDGLVIEKHLTLGESVKEDTQVFTLSDLSTVWAEIAVPAKDLDRVQVGQSVMVKATSMNVEVPGKIIYVGSLVGDQTRTAMSRITLANPKKVWRPGLYITVGVISGETTVPVAVVNEALQSNEGKTNVFVQTKEGFVAQPVKTGRSDGTYTEIVEGLQAGMPYAATNSFVLKAELGKGSAEHDH